MKTLINMRTDSRLKVSIAYIEAILFFVLGIYFSLFAKEASSSMGVDFHHVNGWVDYKAIYGGLHLGLGAFMFLLLYRKSYDLVLILTITLTGGLALVRGISMITDHAPTFILFIQLGIELIAVVVNSILLVSGKTKHS